MPYRAAKWRDIERAGDVLADAFWHESVIGELIHPKRAAFPHDYRRYWRHKVTEWYWDCQHQLLAAYIARPGPNNRNEEVLVGVADWNRMGKRPVQYRERPGLRYLCNVMKAVVLLQNRISCFFRPNRAADPVMSDIGDRLRPLTAHHWSGPRSDGWYLNFIGVKPSYQGQGYGGELVTWGIQQADDDNVAASVISGVGKDDFYRKYGLDVEVGNVTDGEGNPLKGRTGGGAILFRNPRSP